MLMMKMIVMMLMKMIVMMLINTKTKLDLVTISLWAGTLDEDDDGGDDDDNDDIDDDGNDDHLTPSSPLWRAAREAKDIFRGKFVFFFGFLEAVCWILMQFGEDWVILTGFRDGGKIYFWVASDALDRLPRYLGCFDMF